MIDLRSENNCNISVQVVKLLTIISFVSIILGCAEKHKSSIYPTESFSVLLANLSNGKPVIGSVNMAYKSYDRKDEYPWCLEINMALDIDSLYKNGLPFKSESTIANKYEDQLLENIKGITIAHYIGHMYNDTFLDIYIYLDKPGRK